MQTLVQEFTLMTSPATTSYQDGVHINTAEAEFSVLRPWIATFRGVSKEKLYLYIGHYEFFRNHGDLDPHRKNPEN